MSGIAGALGIADADDLARRMVRKQAHRGPDGEGFYRDAESWLGVCHLSITDLSSGAQPTYNEQRDQCLIFDGKIYNHIELRSDLARRGHTILTQSDTEVIIHAYEEYGAQCVAHLRGMFAFAIRDSEGLFLARDPWGIKPLYYTLARGGRVFLFASELKALLEYDGIDTSVDERALADRVLLGYPAGNRTFLTGIRCLPPGHTLRVSRGADGLRMDLASYCRSPGEEVEDVSLKKAVEDLTRMLLETMDLHLEADVEVGLSLSGGIDSSTLALLMRERRGRGLRLFTYADRENHPDLACARAVAASLGASHHVEMPSFEDYFGAIAACALAEEQPSGLAALPLFLLCQSIGRSVKVCLDGVGADGLFCGLPEYLNRQRKIDRIQRGLERLARLGVQPSDEAQTTADALLGAGDSETYVRRLYAINQRDPLVRLHLDIGDKYAMAFGVEMRAPYLDSVLSHYVNRLPLWLKLNEMGIQKYILKHVFTGLSGIELIDIALRKKLGLPSSGSVYRARFVELCERSAPDRYAASHALNGYFETKFELLMFDLFRLLFLGSRGAIPEGFSMTDFIRDPRS
jgi:asparagine synthase (glutamine-hydrolysing)